MPDEDYRFWQISLSHKGKTRLVADIPEWFLTDTAVLELLVELYRRKFYNERQLIRSHLNRQRSQRYVGHEIVRDSDTVTVKAKSPQSTASVTARLIREGDKEWRRLHSVRMIEAR
ncbi:MAG: hypothetical protein RJS97_08835 [Parvibaculaceae bacterium]